MVLHVRKNSVRRNLLIVLLLCVAFGCIGYGVYGIWRAYHATHESHPVLTDKTITYSTDQPSETKPTEACSEYTTEDALPERIAIPSIGVNGCVLKVGIDQHNAIAVPDNIYAAGWYVRSVLPGQPGLSVIDGHISGQYNIDAIFQHLSKLKEGDTFTVTLGSGKVLTYEIYATQSVPLDEAAEVLLTKDPAVTSQLNLITCGGQYDKASKLYDHRIIVSATLR